jgi:DNA-binding transcriptional LysR family regulator
MDSDLLKTFLEVYRTRHFGQAADNLYVTQSTVSARIRQLEEELGAPLFIRARNDIQMTAAGQRLLKYAESILTTWNRARQEIAVEEEDRIPLTVAGLPSLWDITLQDWLHSISEQNPELMIQAEVLEPNVIIRRLLDATLDIGFVFEAPQISALEILSIITIPLIMVSASANLTPEQALRGKYILVDWGTSFSTAHAHHFSGMPAPALRMGLGRMARDFLLANGGSAYLAESMVTEHLDKGDLFRVDNAPVIERSAAAVFSRQPEKRELIKNVLEYYPI